MSSLYKLLFNLYQRVIVARVFGSQLSHAEIKSPCGILHPLTQAILCFTQGTLAGLLIGLGQLNCSELRLKRLCCRSGLLGIDRVMNYALSEWMTDIRGTQLPRILGGVGPVHSFLQLFQGLVDLVWLPIDQYRRDGRVMRGLQRGANSFTTSSAMAFLELTNRVVQMIQVRREMPKKCPTTSKQPVHRPSVLS